MDDLLGERLFKAYRKGLLDKPVVQEYRPPAFDFLFKQVFCLKVPARRRIQVSKIWRSSFQGLCLARKGRMEESSEMFRCCWTELKRMEGYPRDLLLARAPLEAAHAYFEYKRGEFDLARTRILSAMEADLELERDVDFMLLEMHRLQSAQNLMRIDLGSGQPARALSLAGAIIAYLEGFTEQLPVHHSWLGKVFVSGIPPAVRRILIPQVANDVVLAFSRFHQDKLEPDFLKQAQIEQYLAKPCLLDESFRLWMLVKQAFCQKDWDCYLLRLMEFLPSGRRVLQVVWYSSLIDLLEACSAMDTAAALRLRERILADAPKWHSLPVPFRSLLGLADNEKAPHRFVSQVATFSASAAV